MSIINSVIKAFVGDKAKKDVKALQPMVAKIRSFDAALEALSHDELRQKTFDFKARIEKDREPIMQQIQALQSEVDTSEDVDRKEAIYGEIDALNEEAYNITENTLNELLPEAFGVIKETAKRFVNNTQIKVQASAFDRQLSGSKEYVTLEGDDAIWSNSWDAAGKEVTWDMVHYDVQL
ncbi:MAG: preprotein translocase subunit SecA, partial [Flavobacteriaceae bacterium]|nr:preprotein translocase subunit SecA [Flavobacteriaceae bacterium]